MAGAASTHRLEPDVQRALERLSKHLGRPKNSLINEAVRTYVIHKNQELERNLEAVLEDLRAYRLRDPDFEEDIEAFAAAEVKYGSDDPAEGIPEVVRKSSARKKIQKILDAARPAALG